MTYPPPLALKKWLHKLACKLCSVTIESFCHPLSLFSGESTCGLPVGSPWQPSIWFAALLVVSKPVVGYSEGLGMGRHMTTELEFQSMPSGNQSCGKVHDLLHHSLDSPALGLMSEYFLVIDQTDLADEPENVINQGATGHD